MKDKGKIMPQTHSTLFNDFFPPEENPPRRIPQEGIRDKLAEGISYSEISDLLRESNDAQFGIVSVYDKDQNAWVRDATHAIPLDKRIFHDHPVLDANNALLRCLSRLRPIDFAIGEKGKTGEIDASKIQDRMKKEFAGISSLILSIANDNSISDEEKREQIKNAEKQFNTLLVRNLHDAHLAEGCKTKEDAEKLLFHYRNLSSVLEPARTLVTLTYDKVAGVFQRETQYPVTKKTEEQKKELEKLRTIDANLSKENKNSHTSQKLAMQEADSLFADRIASDETALSAQARKTHLVGSKNAFIVKNELIPGPLTEEIYRQSADDDNTLWLGRMGSPVFVGKGESEETLQIHTKENLEQIRMKAQELRGKNQTLHLTALNTVSPQENQSTIIRHLYGATREEENNNDDISYAPTNVDGTFRALDVSPNLDLPPETLGGVSGLRQADRLDSVSRIMRAAAKLKNILSLVNCASGQDRTGTAVEKTTQDWMKERYATLKLDNSNIETMRAEGGNAAEITTHHIHGSPGMKQESMANNFFGFGRKTFMSDEANREFYRKSSGTNKKNTVDNVSFLKTSKAYEDSFIAFKDSLNKTPQDSQKIELCSAGRAILEQIQAIKEQNPKKENDLKLILDSAKRCFDESTDKGKTVKNVDNLIELTKKVSENKAAPWQRLATGLALFCCMALVVAGMMLSVPTGGFSLIAAAAAAVAAYKLSDVREEQLIDKDQRQELSSSVENYKQALHKIEKKPVESKQESKEEADPTAAPKKK